MSAGMSVPRMLRCGSSALQPSRNLVPRRPIFPFSFHTIEYFPSADFSCTTPQQLQQPHRGIHRSYVSLSSSGRRTLATPSAGSSAPEDDTNRNSPHNVDPVPTDTPSTTPAPSPAAAAAELVYESPLGHLVTRLRAVSLTTGLCGGLGVPLLLAAKGSSAAALASFDPSSGLLAIAMAFGTATVGSTVAVHYIFHPYVYSMERIPVRVCAYKQQPPAPNAEAEAEDNAAGPPCADESAPAPNPGPARDVLYKAVSRSLFLTRKETVFDPATDLAPYKGLRPLCNAVVKGHTLLYMHPDYVHDPILRRALALSGDRKKPVVDVEKDDDFL